MKKGFTIMEMIIALGVFSISMMLTLGIYTNMIDMQNKSFNFRAVNNSLNFTMEKMSREIRTGFSYCGIALLYPCSSSQFSFKAGISGNPEITYRLNNNVIEMAVNGGSFSPLTSSGVVVTNLEFLVDGQNVGDGKQPVVTIIMKAESGASEKTKAYLNLQTTIIQRKLDS